MKVFVSGSISIKKLPDTAIAKLDSIMDKNFTIIIGDAKGVDSNVQKYLIKKQYKNVMVYYAGNNIRTNIGNWQTVAVSNEKDLKGRDLYTLKDIKMANDADYGLMIWDGISKGTLNNIEKMKINNKRFFVIIKEMVVDEKHFDQIIEIKTNQEQNSNLGLF